MPLIIEGGRVPSRWAREGNSRPVVSPGTKPTEQFHLALINNMPDAALEDTELQFFDLLDDASGALPIRMRLYSLTGIPRSDRGQRHLDRFYCGLDEIWEHQVDAVIITGTEPREPDLRDEPYWGVLADVLDWAERNTVSTVLSCLAAHASVLHSDGIVRHPLSDKKFGVFAFDKTAKHPLIAATEGQIRFPHSRWNEVRADALTACGYSVLTQSTDGGVDMFVKDKKQSLFVYFQGHPEYGAETMLKEYRRDIKRFVRRERKTYPSMPEGYFDELSTRLAADFRDVVLADGHFDRPEEIMEGFPEADLARALRKTWRPSAAAIYHNWLSYVMLKKADVSRFPTPSVDCEDIQRKRSALT